MRAGIFEAILPHDNEKDVTELPENLKKSMKLHFVDSMDEVLALALAAPLPEPYVEVEIATPPAAEVDERKTARQ